MNNLDITIERLIVENYKLRWDSKAGIIFENLIVLTWSPKIFIKKQFKWYDNMMGKKTYLKKLTSKFQIPSVDEVNSWI
jgi:hypothetical protein